MERVNRILIIRGGALGDFLLTLPTLNVLRSSFPNAYIELMSHSSFLPLARRYINRGESIDKDGLWNFYIGDGELSTQLKNYFRNFDLIILFVSDEEGYFRENLTRSGVKNIIHHQPVPIDNNGHFSRYLMDSLLPLNLPANGYIPELSFMDEEIQFAEEFFKFNNLSKKVLAIHPGSGSEKKNWKVERFAKVADMLSKRGFKTILISGPADEKTKERFLDLSDFTPVLAENLLFMKLAAIFNKCSCYIGNDSGITHLSAITGITTIAIYGATDPVFWGPIGRNAIVIKKESLEDIGVEDVLAYIPF
ncbi:MAG: glycosyltransferase family 9 protein [Nitrospinae bacterium]|nr:glycosyltransferase family 9 protein [Nitrospinota bacterium]